MDRVDRRLAAEHAALGEAVARLLDVETGLHEVLLPTYHATLGAELARVLDVEAGLGAIVPAPLSAPAEPTHHADASSRMTTSHSTYPLHELARLLEARGPEARLLARSHRSVLDGYLNALDWATSLASYLAETLARVVADAQSYFHADASDIVSAVSLARSVGRNLTDALDDGVANAHTHALAHATTDALAQAIANSNDPRNAYAQLRPLVDASELTDAHAKALRLARDLARDLQLGRDALDRALNDFTDADIRGVDLARFSLDGVRWSRATRWPPEWEEEIVRTSVEVAPGIFEIRRGTERTPTSVH